MDGYVIDRSDGRTDGEDWAQSYEELPGSPGISLIVLSTTEAGVGPRLHRHTYAETFLIRRGGAVFTIGADTVVGRAGQLLVVPAGVPHTFRTEAGGYEAVHIHSSPTMVSEYLE